MSEQPTEFHISNFKDEASRAIFEEMMRALDSKEASVIQIVNDRNGRAAYLVSAEQYEEYQKTKEARDGLISRMVAERYGSGKPPEKSDG
jgi:23S rRNA A2030 N6-methylase RlmJ